MHKSGKRFHPFKRFSRDAGDANVSGVSCRRRITALLVLSLLMLYISSMPTEGEIPFELYAVRYGSSVFRSEFIFEGDRTERKIPFAWLYYVIKHNDRIILVDTGFSDRRNALMFGVTFTDPTDDLAAIGIRPEAVTDVILTHAHFDHTGNVNRYTNARVYTQLSDLKTIRGLVNDDPRVIPFDDALDFDDRIHIEHVGGHTKGSSAVWITLPGKKMLLAGDEAYLRENVTREIPVGSHVDRNANLNFLKRARASGAECFTFHDPSITRGDKNVVRVYP